MSVRGVHVEECGHASCRAREQGLAAQGEAAYRFWREHMAPPGMWLRWEDMRPERQQLWIDLVEHAEEAFWEAWGAG